MQTIEIGTDEPLSGYLSRLAASRGVRLWDFRIHGSILARYNKKPHYYDRVSAVTGLDPAVLKRHDLVKVGGTFNAFDMTFDVNDIWAKSARACPYCIREDLEQRTGRVEARPRLRFGWMLRTLGRCAVHGEPLVVYGSDYDKFSYGDFAGTVSRHLGGTGVGASRAGAGVTLTDCETSADVERPSSRPMAVCGAELTSDLYFQGRLRHRAAAVEGQAAGTPELRMLDRMTVPAALLLTEVIGGMELFGDRYWRRAATGEDRQAAVTAGFEVTRRGYDGLRGFLSQRDEIHWRTSRRGHFKNLYGRLQELLSSRIGAEGYEDVIRFVAEHAHSNHTLGPEDGLLGTSLPRRLHSIRTAEVAHGIHRNTLRTILDSAGLLPAGSGQRGDGRVVIAAETFDRLIADWRERLPVEEAKARFGISGAALDELVRHGLVAESDRGDRGSRRLSRASYLEFLERLDRLPRGIPDAGMRNLQDMTRIVSRTYGEIISLILDGTIKKSIVNNARLGHSHGAQSYGQMHGSREDGEASRIGELGFDRIFVDPLEVKQAFQAASPPGITFECAERMLGTTTKTVKRLAAAGLLKTVVADNPMHRIPQTYVSPSGLEEFQATYVSLFEYSKGRGQIARVKKRLVAAGIMPVFEEAGTATFYRRDALPAALE
jgi:hypothetical protein